VRYGRPRRLGRAVVSAYLRGLGRVKRRALAFAIPRTAVFAFFLKRDGCSVRCLPPREKKIPLGGGSGASRARGRRPRHKRKMLALRAGCVQPALRGPSISTRGRRALLDVWDFAHRGARGGLLRRAALPPHRQEKAPYDMRALIDAWWPMLSRGEVDAI